ncbi:MAG: murein transglycosylase domain-containing protein [Rikenellaceae bacterium]
MKLLTPILLLLAPLAASAEVIDTQTTNLDADYEVLLQQMEAEFNSFSDSLEVSYDNYTKKLEAEFAQFEKMLEDKWGKDCVEISDRYKWVEYDDDYKSRSVVDFEKGEAKVEIVVTDKELADKAAIERKLTSSMSKLLSSRARTVEYKSQYIPQEPIAKTPIATNIIKPKTTSSKESPAAAIVKSEKATTTKSSPNKNIVTLNTKLVPNYLSENAKRYTPLIMENATRFNIDPSLIYGIIEVESRFNPTAGSNMGALGLMQIVPRSAGRDTYKYLYGKDILPSRSYLFQPEKNIEMGVAYLKILESRYFHNVTDAACRELCMIAAYNTGAGNVSRALAGHTNISKTIPKINSMTYPQLFTYLERNLPHAETRAYIGKVTASKAKYSK